ncbi:hypothetical protein ABK040_003381 [Willaertia magna]
MKKWTGGIRSRVTKKKTKQQTQVEFFQRKRRKEAIDSIATSKSSLASLDINSLLRTQLQSRRETRKIEIGNSSSEEDEETQSEEESSDEENHTNNNSNSNENEELKETTSQSSQQENMIVFIDEGIDKTLDTLVSDKSKNEYIEHIKSNSPPEKQVLKSTANNTFTNSYTETTSRKQPLVNVRPLSSQSNSSNTQSGSIFSLLQCEEDSEATRRFAMEDDDEIVLEESPKEEIKQIVNSNKVNTSNRQSNNDIQLLMMQKIEELEKEVRALRKENDNLRIKHK